MAKDKSEKKPASEKKPLKDKALTRRLPKPLAKADKTFTVASLEAALLREYPREDAESWDVMGLTVGEGGLPVTKVAVALDPTVEAIRKAADLGASVLVTHHPPYLSGPDSFAPADSVVQSPGAGVWAAIQNRVALMNFHTALDVSKRAQLALPQILGLKYVGQVIEPVASSKRKGYGQLCEVPSHDGKAQTLSELAHRCVSNFGRAPKVWGDFARPVKTVATALGSAGDIGRRALELGCDCIVCGEMKYHSALDLSQAGLAIIELGHDVSELPLAAVLAKTIADVGFPKEGIAIIDQSANWSYPETIRL